MWFRCSTDINFLSQQLHIGQMVRLMPKLAFLHAHHKTRGNTCYILQHFNGNICSIPGSLIHRATVELSEQLG